MVINLMLPKKSRTLKEVIANHNHGKELGQEKALIVTGRLFGQKGASLYKQCFTVAVINCNSINSHIPNAIKQKNLYKILYFLLEAVLKVCAKARLFPVWIRNNKKAVEDGQVDD